MNERVTPDELTLYTYDWVPEPPRVAMSATCASAGRWKKRRSTAPWANFVFSNVMTRATARPAFAKAHADQLAHFAAADAKR